MTGYPFADLFLTILYIAGWILWIVLLFLIVMDIFRSRDLSGWAKAAWLLFVIVLPLLGVLAYLVVRGGTMHERYAREVEAQEDAFRSYVREAAAGDGHGGGDGHSSSEELIRLAELRDRGLITDEEFQKAKAKVLQ
jgi:hypothetical protein